MTKYISMFFLRDCLEDDEEFVVGEMTLELEASAAFIGVVALLVDGTIIFPLSSLISVFHFHPIILVVSLSEQFLVEPVEFWVVLANKSLYDDL